MLEVWEYFSGIFVALQQCSGFFSVGDMGRKKGNCICLFLLLKNAFNRLVWLVLYATEFHRKLCYWWYMFHILIDTAILINFNFYDSDSQTPMWRERKKEIEALRWFVKDFFRPPGKFFHWLSLLLSIGKS